MVGVMGGGEYPGTCRSRPILRIPSIVSMSLSFPGRDQGPGARDDAALGLVATFDAVVADVAAGGGLVPSGPEGAAWLKRQS